MNRKTMGKITSAVACTTFISFNGVVSYGDEQNSETEREAGLVSQSAQNISEDNILNENLSSRQTNTTSGPGAAYIQNNTYEQAVLNDSNISEHKTYYISADAPLCDLSEGAGLSADRPMSLFQLYWPTVLKPGDTVKFRNGDKFNDDILFNKITEDPNETERVTFTNYKENGEHASNELPVFSLYKITSENSWTSEGNNLWYIDFSDKNSHYEGYRGDLDISNSELSDPVRRAYNSVGYIYNPEDGRIYSSAKADKEDLHEDYDFCTYSDTDTSTYRVYVYCYGNPNAQIEKLYFADGRPIFNLRSNVNIENLKFELCGGHAISNNYNTAENCETNNVKIENCEISMVGGTYNSDGNRAGNGIEFMSSGNNIEITKNKISNCYDTATTLQGKNGNWNKVNIHDNVFENNSQAFEVWSEIDDDNYSGHKMLNVNFSNNLCINEGRGWGYDAREDKQKACDIELQHMQINDTGNADIKISNNVFFNPVRFMYLHLMEDRYINGFKNNMTITNNRIYLKNNAKLVYRDEQQDYQIISREPYSVRDYDKFAEAYSTENGDKKTGNCTINIGNYNISDDGDITSLELCGPDKPDFSENKKSVENNINLKNVTYPKEWNNEGVLSFINETNLPLDNEYITEGECTDCNGSTALHGENNYGREPVMYTWIRNTEEKIQGGQVVKSETIEDGRESVYIPKDMNGTYYYYCIASKDAGNNRVESEIKKVVKADVNTPEGSALQNPSGNTESGQSGNNVNNNNNNNNTNTNNISSNNTNSNNTSSGSSSRRKYYTTTEDNTEDANSNNTVNESADSIIKKDNKFYTSDGKAVTGWVDYKNNKYYCNADSSMCLGWQKINNSWYYFNNDNSEKTGAMETGWYEDKGSWYYLNNDGKMKTGWLKDEQGMWYYLKSSGAMAKGWIQADGKWYFLRDDGVMMYNTRVNGYKIGSNGEWIK